MTHRKPRASQPPESKAEWHADAEGDADRDEGHADRDEGDADGDEGGADAAVDNVAAPTPALAWSDLTEMLKSGLTSAAFDEQLRYFYFVGMTLLLIQISFLNV